MSQTVNELSILDQVLEEADRIAAAYSASEERLQQEIIERRPERSAEDAARYSNYASAARCIAGTLRKTAMKALP